MSRVAKDADSAVPTAAASIFPVPRPDELLSLAHAACAGDADAINTLIVSVGGGMLKTVRKVLGPGHPDVDDVTQDAVLALLSSLRAFRGECTVAHFAHRVALLTALAARRRLRTRDRWTEADTAPESVADERGASPLMRAMASRRRTIVRELFDELSEPMAEALALHFVLGYTVEEIAATADVPANTVWSRLRLGKQALKKKLSRDSRITELLRSRE
jgi:RNA polymerase sigma-70 factor (ECF subfamily)